MMKHLPLASISMQINVHKYVYCASYGNQSTDLLGFLLFYLLSGFHTIRSLKCTVLLAFLFFILGGLKQSCVMNQVKYTNNYCA